MTLTDLNHYEGWVVKEYGDGDKSYFYNIPGRKRAYPVISYLGNYSTKDTLMINPSTKLSAIEQGSHYEKSSEFAKAVYSYLANKLNIRNGDSFVAVRDTTHSDGTTSAYPARMGSLGRELIVKGNTLMCTGRGRYIIWEDGVWCTKEGKDTQSKKEPEPYEDCVEKVEEESITEVHDAKHIFTTGLYSDKVLNQVKSTYSVAILDMANPLGKNPVRLEKEEQTNFDKELKIN